MKFVADLHIHSHFSRATSRELDPEHLSIWAQKKGILVVGTGDFTHPGWVSELREKLVETEDGLLALRPDLEERVNAHVPSACSSRTRFVLSGEISCIYKKGDKTRKVHHLVLMPDLPSVLKLNEKLERIGNIRSDGRPILGLDSRDLLETVLEASDRAFFIPAHVWTPWFSLFGSKSGFEAIEECFEDLTPHIHALETGLSSDPPMNRLLSPLDPYLLVSNSDAHSPGKLGREANLFDTFPDYERMVKAMTDGEGFEGTIEFFPEEGKYHFDGHRKCNVCLHPAESVSRGDACPVCGRPLTLGVLHRITQMADRRQPQLSKPFYNLVPLPEILSEILKCGPAAKKVMALYEDLLETLGPEIRILLDVPAGDIEKAGGPLLAKAIDRMHRNRVIRQEGYDGEYGVIRLFREQEMDELAGQAVLFETQAAGREGSRLGVSLKRRPPKKPENLEPPKAPGDPVLDPLNGAQREAVTHEGGHLLIVAGPGTGKTMTLTHRIAHLVRSARAVPAHVLALTFTNKAATELKERILKMLPTNAAADVRVSTFHRFCLEILRQESGRINLSPDFTLCSEWDAQQLAQQVSSEAGHGRRKGPRLLKELPALKMATIHQGGITSSPSDVVPLFQKYQRGLRDLGMLDLDDLLVETLRLFLQHPDVADGYAHAYPWIFVDEYQDTNPGQAALLKCLVRDGSTRLCAIGDPDQAIYGFRGADVRNFFRFSQDFPGSREIFLSRNYRSTQTLLDCASKLLGKENPLKGEVNGGGPLLIAPCRTQGEEAEMIVEQIEKVIGGISYFSLDSGRVGSHEEGETLGFGDMAVLFRLNAQGDALEEAFSRAGIPYTRSGEKSLIERHPVKIIWRFLQALLCPDRHYYRESYLSLPEMKGVDGEKVLEECAPTGSAIELIERAVSLHGLDELTEDEADALRRLKEMSSNFRGAAAAFLDSLSLDRGIDHTGLLGDRVSLMSLHAAKGLEWPVVFITGCEDGLIPFTLFGETDREEERRLFYVGVTRAKRRLILSYAKQRLLNGRSLEMKPSPFLDAIPEGMCEPVRRTGWKPKVKPKEQLKLF
jgi:DNA helicase-2/ATP-dependent DNA helicase PcrA